MGFRFRKSIKILPGVKVNISPTGFSTTVGTKGASYNINHRGKGSKGGVITEKMLWAVLGVLVAIFLLIGLIINLSADRRQYKHPVVVQASGVRIRGNASAENWSPVIASATAGDTLELHEIQKDGWCVVTPTKGKPQFKDNREGYILRKYLSIPDSTVQEAKKGRLF